MHHSRQRGSFGRALVTAGGFLLAVGCSSDNSVSPGPCETVPPAAECEQSCASSPCSSGFYCGGDETCTADCSADGTGCRADEACTANGRCVAIGTDDAGNLLTDGGVIPQSCADITVQATGVTPTIILVVDKSGSMNAEFEGNKSRWDVVRETLLDPDGGVIPPLASQVHFGVALYTATNGGNAPGVPAEGTCPMLELTAPALDNVATIEAGYLPRVWRSRPGDDVVDPEDPDGFVGEDTPTGDAIDGVVSWLQSSGELPSTANEPVVLLLATDGLPDRCEDGDPNTTSANNAARAEVVDAVSRAHTNHNVSTYALFVGSANNTVTNHMNDVAEAGHGNDTFYEAANASALRSALSGIVTGQLSCALSLNGEIPDLSKACNGTVKLGGNTLTCGTQWEATGPSTIEILGAACDQLKAGAPLTASFPCGGIVLY